MKEIIVTTTDIKEPYKIIGPVFYSLTNKGLFSNQFDKLSKKYKTIVEEKKNAGHISDNDIPWTNLIGEYMTTESDLDLAFFISVEELKLRVFNLECDAIVGFRFDLNFNSNSLNEFFVRVTGTAVQIKY